nr:GDT1-like protein 4 [Ipomoea batatas]
MCLVVNIYYDYMKVLVIIYWLAMIYQKNLLVNYESHFSWFFAVLYAFFGLRLLYIAWRSDSKASQKKEIEEVEEKLEAGQGKTAVRRFFSRFCTPIYLESFILTFLAEWGDRSQIATIALATHKNAIGVAVGATIGHTVCTSLAVVGGSMLASKISQRTVATVGGLLFLGFSLSSYFYPPL